MKNEFSKNEDKEYRVSIINSLKLIKSDEIIKKYLKKVDEDIDFNNEEVPLIYVNN